MIGDREVDMQAGKEIGAQTILITTAEQTGGVIATAPNLLSATLCILKKSRLITKHQN
jgi:phosphoglycolate phosphatase-like HAD superfamily hydrolase